MSEFTLTAPKRKVPADVSPTARPLWVATLLAQSSLCSGADGSSSCLTPHVVHASHAASQAAKNAPTGRHAVYSTSSRRCWPNHLSTPEAKPGCAERKKGAACM